MRIPAHILSRPGVVVQPDRKHMHGPLAIALWCPMKTVSGMNVREHHMARYKRQRAERKQIAGLLFGKELPPLPVKITLVRSGVNLLDVGDNLPSAFKATRDEIAKFYGVDDGGSDIRWEYDQKKVDRYSVGVSINIVSLGERNGR